MPAEAGVLTVEFKVNLLSPAQGERFVAVGKIVKAGRTITVTHAEAHAVHGDAPQADCHDDGHDHDRVSRRGAGMSAAAA